MPAPINSSVYQADLFGSAFRARWGQQTVNNGDVRDIGGFLVDVTGTVSRGERTYRSTVTAGPGSTTYDPAKRPAHTPPPLDAALPSSSLIALQGQSLDQARIDELNNRPSPAEGENPYAVSLPAYVDMIQHENAGIEQITSVGYYSGVDFSKEQVQGFDKAQIKRLKALADIERQLSAEYGEPVKLAWDNGAQEYLALRPGQQGYDRVASVNDLVARLPKDLRLMGYDADAIRQMLA